ncbi:cytochrome c, partial [Halomonas sp. BBD48]|nr:cytochrome c [Halomonas sp. BBD48]
TAGKQLFEAHGCSGCHMGKSSVRAPSLDGLYGRSVALESGEVILADEAYIRDSILQPDRHIAAGYEPIMPSFAGQLKEEEILRIVAYIKSLQPGDWIRTSVEGNEGEGQ